MTAWWDGFLWGTAVAAFIGALVHHGNVWLYRRAVKIQQETIDRKDEQLGSLIDATDRLLKRLQEEMDYQ